MMNMVNLISWFQLEYPKLTRYMKDSTHHLTHQDIDDRLVRESDRFGLIENINPYHCEGDVWTHTMMVCKQAENAPYEVQIAALLHDIGKPSTRKVNPKNGRVSFYNHDAVSAFMALEILNREELELSKDQKVRIFNAIALHTQVFKQTADELSRTCTSNAELQDLIIGLGQVDNAGRFTDVPHTTLSESDMGYCDRVNVCPTVEKEVVILCGLPGAGKSTYVDSKYGGTSENFGVISRDDCLVSLASQHFQAKEFTYNEAWDTIDQKEVDRLLQLQIKEIKLYPVSTTIIDMTHMSKKSRRKSLSHFGSDYKKKCVVFLPDMQKLFLQNSSRAGKVIDRSVIDRMMRSFYPPTFEEFDEIEYII